MDSKIFSGFYEKLKSGIPRGEIWIPDRALRELCLEPKQESFITLSSRIGADICYFSYSSPVQELMLDSGEMGRLIKEAHDLGLVCGITVDGPFERTVGECGFMEVMCWFHDEGGRLSEYLEKYTALATAELEAAALAGADLLVLCDDIAYNQGPYFSLHDFEKLLLPLYRRLAYSTNGGAPFGFHSDGNVQKLLAGLIGAGFTLFSLEPEALDLPELCRSLPEDTILLSGIKAEWLMGPVQHDEQAEEIIQYVCSLKSRCRIVLSSLCGLTGADSLERLIRIYSLIDRSYPGAKRGK